MSEIANTIWVTRQHNLLLDHVAQENTVINKEGFSKRKIKSTVESQELHHTLGFPTIKEVTYIIRINHIQDCPVDTEDVDNAKMIWKKHSPSKRENHQEETHLSDWGYH